MNRFTLTSSASAIEGGGSSPASADALRSRFALRIAAGLTERSQHLGPDLDERLRFAREKALEAARSSRMTEASTPVGITRSGVAVLGRFGSQWWLKLASVAPVLVLLAGLVLIERWQRDAQTSVAAEIDAAILSDALPPKAYGDAGFAEFLKSPSE